ncbi:YncE family protein [Streptomyces sp. NPDC093586]|uniref:YncE family protein n=1 Tax=Streptomyces sp. NPDC093586 TaxID=3366042 RepID=UPI00380C72AD
MPAATPVLLVSDHVDGSVHVLTVPDGAVVGRLTGRHLSEHAGFLALPEGRVACVDDRRGELLVLDPFAGKLVERTVPVAVPAEHLACDPSGRRLAVTTGLGKNGEPWSDLLTVLDLATGEAARVRTRVGEPGVTVLGGGDPLVVLRHREPGALAVHRFADLLAAPPGCPPVPPHALLPLPDDGHGDAHAPGSGHVFAATGEGVHRARRKGDTLVAEAVVPWGPSARGWYLRFDTRRQALWTTLRGGDPDPLRWPEWTNQAWRHDLETGRTLLTDLGPGLVFRLALARRHTAFTRIHPAGDELVLLGADDIARRFPLPAMDGAPRRGGTPWEGVQRRAVAASPGSDWIAVTRGGHGEVHIVDAETGHEATRVRLGTPLHHGGHMALRSRNDGADGDPVGR